MSEADSTTHPHKARGRGRRLLGWFPDLLVVALLVLAVAAWHFDLGTRWGLAGPDPRTDPGAVAAPPGLDLPTLSPAAAVAAPQTAGTASPAKVSAALLPLIRNRKLGPHVRVLVTDLTSGKVVLDHGTGTVTPASTMKTLTSISGLAALGPSTRFTTSVSRVPGTKRVVLVGGGDPFLTSAPQASGTYPHRADIRSLARQTAMALKKAGLKRVALSYDDTLFTGPSFNPHWPATYRTDVAPPITALWVDEGRSRSGYGYSSDPSLDAARVFAQDLAGFGVTSVATPKRAKAPASAEQVAAVSSAPLGQIVSRLLLVSDNNAAEVVAHQVGIKESTGGSFVGGAAGVRKVLTGLGVPLKGAVIHDGSGLSRQDRLDPQTLAAVLRVAGSADHPTLHQVLTGLPVAGFSGSLEDRFDEAYAPGRGRVQAKTGTLTGIHGLAGVATDLDGDVLGFVMIADRVAGPDQTIAARTLDKAAGALGACHCR